MVRAHKIGSRLAHQSNCDGPYGKYSLNPHLISVSISNMEADVPGPASPPDPPQDQPGKTAPMPEYIAVVLYAVRHPARLRPPSPRHRPPPRHRPHIPHHRGVLRHRQPRDHPRPPQPRHPACHRAGALAARARRNRPRHRHRDPPHPHRRTTARASSPPIRTANRAGHSPKPRHASRCPPAGTIPNSSCPHWRISIVRCAAAPSAAPSPRSASTSPSSPASAPAPSGTGCSKSCTTSAATSSPP